MNNNQWDDDDDHDLDPSAIDLTGSNPHPDLTGNPHETSEGDAYSDDGSSASEPPEDIDFSLTYALQTFVATVEGQASVIKGDSLVLLDDANSYWWLVRVLKTEDVGYIPAENIETPYERLARLNKHRNVDLASSTPEEQNQPPSLTRLAATKSTTRQAPISPDLSNPSGRKVFFAPPTYVEHPGVTWSDSESGEEGRESGEEEDGEEGEEEEEEDFGDGGEGGGDVERVEEEVRSRGNGDRDREGELHEQDEMRGEEGMGMVEDDGVAWEDGVAERERARRMEEKEKAVAGLGVGMAPGHAQRQAQGTQVAQQQREMEYQLQPQETAYGPVHPSSADTSIQTATSPGQSLSQQQSNQQPTGLSPKAQHPLLDPAEVRDAEPRKISLTPAVARNSIGPGYSPVAGGYQAQQQGLGLGLGSAPGQGQQGRNVSIASSNFSTVSLGSVDSRDSPLAGDDDGSRKIKKAKEKDNKKPEDARRKSDGGESSDDPTSRRRKSSGGGVFSGLFKKKDKKDKGVSGGKGIEGHATRRQSTGGDSDSMVGRSSEDSLGIGLGIGESPGSMSQPTEPSPSVARGNGNPGAGPGGYGNYSSPGSVLSGASATSAATSTSTVSPHALRLQQIDQKQQQLYQQYMARSPSSPVVDPSRSYGLQAAATVAVSSAAQRLVAATQSNGRPGSIILQPNPGAPGLLLNVLRVFAGEYVESESSFKTVLLGDTTSAKDLVKQAVQRFRLTGDKGQMVDMNEYFLTIKEIDGDELALESQMRPLEAFNEMAKRIGEEDAAFRSATVKRSSVGSISSVSSNLSLNPAIARLGMSDFSDDSVVKLFLNRRKPGQAFSGGFESYGSLTDQQTSGESGLPTMEVTQPSEGHGSAMVAAAAEPSNPSDRGLKVHTGRSSPERLASPAARFTVQIVVYPDDLPDGMGFDPQTEAIIPKTMLRERERERRLSAGSAPSSPSQQATERRKYFVMSKNTTVAEAVEAGLERFGIAEGVVDGGDDVEDKGTNRRSLQKIRYGLAVLSSGSELLLNPSHKIMEAYSTPPVFKTVEKTTPENRRRSREMSQQAANPADIRPSDPVFVLRRKRAALLAVTKNSGVPLDDLALRQRRSSDASIGQRRSSDASVGRSNATASVPASTEHSSGPSRQEIIAAQRAASRANQMAILSAQANAQEGVDVLMADRSTIRSSKLSTGEGEQYRYSYISGEGETYDISQLIEEELRPAESDNKLEILAPPSLDRKTTDTSIYHTAQTTPTQGVNEAPGASPLDQVNARLSTSSMTDLLQGALQATGMEDPEIANRLDRVVSRVRSCSVSQPGSISAPIVPRSESQDYSPRPRAGSGYSGMARDGSLSPVLEDIPSSIRRDVEAASSISRSSSRALSSPTFEHSFRSSSRQSNATARLPARGGHHQQPSIASVISDFSGADTETGGGLTPQTAQTSLNPTPPNVLRSTSRSNTSGSPSRPPVRYKDDFGMKNMMAVIDARARRSKPPPQPKKQIDEIDRMFFGEHVDMSQVHPDVRKVYEPFQKKLDDVDRELDELLSRLMASGRQK